MKKNPYKVSKRVKQRDGGLIDEELEVNSDKYHLSMKFSHNDKSTHVFMSETIAGRAVRASFYFPRRLALCFMWVLRLLHFFGLTRFL